MFEKIKKVFNNIDREKMSNYGIDKAITQDDNGFKFDKLSTYNQTILSALPQMLFIVGRNGEIIDAQCSKGSGIREPKFYIDKNLRDVFEADNIDELIESIKNIKQGDEVKKIEITCTINGKQEHFVMNVAFFNEFEILIIKNRDTSNFQKVNEIKQYQVELESQNEILNNRKIKLKKANEYNKAILNALPQILLIITRDGLITDAQCASGSSIMPPSFYINKHITELLEESDVNNLFEIIKNIKEDDGVKKFEISITINNKVEHLLMNITYFSETDVLIIVNSVTENVERINEIKQYQVELASQNDVLISRKKELEKANSYNEAILNALPQMLFVVTREGFILDAQCAKGSYIREPKFYLRKFIVDTFDSEQASELCEMISCISQTDEVKNLEISCIINDKKEYMLMHVAYFSEEEVLVLANRVTELREQFNTIKYLSYYDQVTGLRNRRNYEEKLYECVRDRVYPLSVIVGDVNGLKLVNDAFGHQSGDRLLLEFAEVLRETGIDEEFIARTGGDEFAIILPRKNKEFAENLVENIKELCTKRSVNGVEVSVSFGIGFAENEEQSINFALQMAEDKMYEEKLYDHATKRDNTIRKIHSKLYEKFEKEKEHNLRVVEYCKKIGEKLGLSESEKSSLEMTAMFHDIGKIGIDESIIMKDDVLTEDEYKQLCKHAEIGYRILKSAEDLQGISESVLCHHENWDGTGYPKGLKNEEIPFNARIIAVVEAFEMRTRLETNREIISESEAINELIANKDKMFEAKLVDIFVEIKNEEKNI